MVKYEKIRVIKAEIPYAPNGIEEADSGNYTLPIESWVTFDVNRYNIEAFVVPPVNGIKEGETYTVDFKIMTYDLEEIDVPKKLIHQITTDPEYLFVGEILEIDPEKRKIIFDCGVELEADWDIAHEETAKKLKKGDWIFIEGKMFGDILDE
jgi:hypothetical protein